MGIRKWNHRGRERLVLSKTWPDTTRLRRFMSNRTVAKELEIRIDYAITTGTWRELKEKLAKEKEANKKDSNPTIREFQAEYLAICKMRNRRPDFKKQALVSIARILGDVRLRDFKRRDADHFLERRLDEEMANATVNRGLAVLRHMLSVAVEREYIESNPLSKYKMLPEVQEALRIMTYDEYRQLIQAVAEEDLVIGVYTVVLGETGMRKSEGLRMQPKHIHKTGPGQHVVMIGKTKGGKVRSVPLSNLAMEWLSKLVRFMDIPYVFVNPALKKPWKDPRGPFFKGREEVGLDWVGFHDLRHFRATQWLMNGVDPRTVQENLGHADIQTTMRYVHFIETHATKAVVEAQNKEVAEWKNSSQSVDTKWIQSK